MRCQTLQVSGRHGSKESLDAFANFVATTVWRSVLASVINDSVANSKRAGLLTIRRARTAPRSLWNIWK